MERIDNLRRIGLYQTLIWEVWLAHQYAVKMFSDHGYKAKTTNLISANCHYQTKRNQRLQQKYLFKTPTNAQEAEELHLKVKMQIRQEVHSDIQLVVSNRPSMTTVYLPKLAVQQVLK